MIADTNVAGLSLVVAGAVLVLGFIAVLALRHRSKGSRPEIPVTMRPGPADAPLESTQLLKLQGWGVVLITFFVLWFPLQWLIEPGQNLKQEDALQDRVDRPRREGRAPLHRGEPARRRLHALSRQRAAGRRDQRARRRRQPDLPVPAQPHHDLRRPEHRPPARSSRVDDIYQVISEGRGAMPSWSIRFAGRAGRPADQRPGPVPRRAELAERPLRGQRLPEQGSLGRGHQGQRGRRLAHQPEGPLDGTALLPELRDRLRRPVEGPRGHDRGVHPVRRQRVPPAGGDLRPVDGLSRAGGGVLRVDDDPVRPVAVRVLVPGARHEDQPRAARPGRHLGGRCRRARSRCRPRGARRLPERGIPRAGHDRPGGGGGRPTGAGCRRRLHGQAGQRAARARPDRVRLDPVDPDGGR